MGYMSEMVLHTLPIEALGAAGLMGPGRPVEHVHSWRPVQVPLGPLPSGHHFLEQWRLRELPDQDAWRAPHYDSFAPPLFLIHQAVVHSSAGIVAVGDRVIAETLSHTAPDEHAYRRLARGIALPRQLPPRRLAGAWISLLAGGEGNYFHAMLLGLARLMAVPENYQAAAAGLLVPRGAQRLREMLALLDLPPSLEIVEVSRAETLVVETLLLPLSVVGDCAYHPLVGEFYARISANVPPPVRRTPRRLYIDRRQSRLRPLTNEQDLVAALAPLGFVAVQPELLSVQDQVRLFRGAEVIVAPHGAALANLGFCRPGTRVLELLTDAYCNWTFRHLAALCRLDYDCVLGRARLPWAELDLRVHLTPWQVPVSHVVAAATQRLAAEAEAA